MPTKEELERRMKEYQGTVTLFTIIIVVCLIMICWLSFENMMLQPTDRFDGCWDYLHTQDDLLRYSFSDPVDYYINVSDLNNDCILSIDDYSDIGDIWLNIKPDCVEMSHHTYKVMT